MTAPVPTGRLLLVVTDAGKLFTIMYILTGVGIIASFLNFMAEPASGREPRGH